RQFRAGLDETIRIEREAPGYPARRRRCAGHHEYVTYRSCLLHQTAAVAPAHGREMRLALDSNQLGAGVQLYGRMTLDAINQIAGHRGRQPAASHEQVHS